MRLLNTWTGQFVDEDPELTAYAILSHTWNKVEQTYQDVLEIQKSYNKSGRLRFSASPAGLVRRAVHKSQDVTSSLIRSVYISTIASPVTNMPSPQR